MEKIKELVPYFALLLVVVFFGLTLSGIGEIKQEISNLYLNLQIQERPPNGDDGPIGNGNEFTDEIDPEGAVRIPTAIIFQARSSPILSPQSDLTVIVNSATKSKDGDLIFNLKVFTDKASAYSRFDAVNTFEIVNMAGANQRPLRSAEAFDSIPAKNAAEGNITFKVGADQDEVILQINTVDDIIFYKFKFKERNYEKVILG